MKVTPRYNSIYTPVSPNNNIHFGAFKPPKLIKDIFIKQRIVVMPYGKGIEDITGVRKGMFGGTICDGAVPMRKFWLLFDKKAFSEIKQKGISTNKSGIPNCFLKAKSDVPISTSFVHDCSVMYLYNNKTNTHALYHSAYDCHPYKLDCMVKKLMPEGITHGIIVPGDSYWYDRHFGTMRDMFNIMKKNNPDAVVNVFNSVSKYPEVVGYRGRTFEIVNAEIQNQIKRCGHFVEDKGQASFRIMDLQGFNTFDRIKYKVANLKDVEKLRHYFKKQGYNNEMLDVLNKELNTRRANIHSIMCCNNEDELTELMECYRYDRQYYEYAEVFKIARRKFTEK